MINHEEILQGLNPEQLEAVTHRSGPLLVFAGAGSGKTRVITRRIAWLISQGLAAAWQILAVTFTNKAAQEMIERVRSMLGERVEGIAMGTFHSICARWLRREIDKLGYSRDFVIFDELDSAGVVKDILRDTDRDIKDASYYYSWIDRFKNEGVTGDAVAEKAREQNLKPDFTAIFMAYEARLRSYQALDFNDLLIKMIELLTESQETLDLFRNRYRYILVDEYQDTNRIQHQLLVLLGTYHGNITVVGDDDQSIYSWRGADYENIFKLKEIFPDIAVVILDHNYRSTQMILDASFAVVKQNTARHEKRLWTEQSQGDPVFIYRAENEFEEADFVASELHKLHEQLGTRWQDCAIFYRINAQSRLFEEALRRRRIPHAVIGGVGFYRRQEVKDVVAYMRLLANPADTPAAMRIINRPARGLGGKTEDLLGSIVLEHKCSAEQAIEMVLTQKLLTGQRAEHAREFSALLQELRREMALKPLDKFMLFLLDRTDYMVYTREQDARDSRNREQNVIELINAVTAFARENPDGRLHDFLSGISLLSDADEFDRQEDRACLMTVHSAKGLEFDAVFMVGMEDNLFPLIRQDDDQRDLSEERRLCYVGMTRARKLLYMTFARSRMIYGIRKLAEPSRFLRDLPAEATEWTNTGLTVRKRVHFPPAPAANQPTGPKPTAALRLPPPPPVVKPETTASTEFVVGAKVIHPKFGVGEILRCKPTGGDWKVDVAFMRVGLKTLMAVTAKLRRLK